MTEPVGHGPHGMRGRLRDLLRDDRGPLVLAVVALVLARVIRLVALEDVPHVMDEIAYDLQARTFATGHLTAPLRLPTSAFSMWFVDDRTSFASIFPPGWPAVLAPFVAIGLGSWVNPLLHGLTTLWVGRIARRLAPTDGRVSPAFCGTVAAAIFGLSPQALVLAASLMSHSLVAFLAAEIVATGLALVHVPHGGGEGASSTSTSTSSPSPSSSSPRAARVRALVVAGAAVGLAAAARPLCGVVLGGVVAAFFAIGLRRRRLTLADALPVAVPVVVAVALLGAYNHAVTGNALRFPQTAYFDEHPPPVNLPFFTYHPGCNSLGFGPGHGCESLIKNGQHSLENAFSNLGDNLTAWFWLAGGGPLVFLFAVVALGRLVSKPRVDLGERLAVFAVIPGAFVLYGLYWYAGTCYGARFYHVALPGLAILAAIGAAHVRAWQRPAATALLVVFFVWDAIFGLRVSAEIAGGYWGTDARFVRLRDGWKEEPALVLVAFGGGEVHARHTYTTFMREVRWIDNIRGLAALSANEPHLRGPVVYARYHPTLMPALRERFPNRKLVLYVMMTAGPDRVVPYESSGLPALEATVPRPVDNFDGFILPPEILQNLR